MNSEEYEQKRRECWEEFRALDRKSPYSLREVNAFAFDKGYALGKLRASCGQVKDTITQEEIEKAAEKNADELRVISGIPGALVPMLHDIAKSSYLQGAQDFLGKQEKDAECQEILTCDKRKVLYHFRMAEACKTGNNPESDYWIGYSKAIQELFGFKGEPCVEPKDAENAVIQGWISRNKRSKWSSPELRIFYGKPQKIDELGKWVGIRLIENIDCTLFPDITWESEPEPVEIIIKRKKNG